MSHLSSFMKLARLCAVLMTAVALCVTSFGQRTRPTTPKPMPPAPSPLTPKPLSLSYTLSFPQPHTHLYEVTFTIGNVSTAQLDISLPTWTPGSRPARAVSLAQR